jgi:hypothetical protein
MYQVPWKDYSEEEIQEIVAFLFRCEGYDVYNAHKTDRRGEVGADLECTKPAEADMALIGIKKKPQQKDIHQLETLAKREARTKIYIYIEEPSASFKEAMKRTSGISFWDSKKLTLETFSKNLRFYVFLIIENYIERTSYRITLSFCKMYQEIEQGRLKVEGPAKADPEMINLLWNAKDRSTSLHKSLRTLQEIYENTDLSSLDEKTKESVVNGFLRGLFNLHLNSLRPLEILFDEFITKYPSNFAQFCIQTKGRSNWTFFWTHVPQLLPMHIIKSLEEAEKESLKLKQFLNESGGGFDSSESVSDLLGDLSRITANGAYWLEETIDDLLSIALFKEWTKMREKTPEWLRFWEHEHGLGYSPRLKHAKTDTEVVRGTAQQAQALQPSKVPLIPKHRLCFVLMPFKANFFRLYEKHIKPVLEENGFTVMKADDIYTPTPIHEVIKKYIKSASLVLADVTNDNPNVLSELGQAHALGKDTIIITQDEGDIPSNFRYLRYLKYDDDEKGWESLRVRLNKAVRSMKLARKTRKS